MSASLCRPGPAVPSVLAVCALVSACSSLPIGGALQPPRISAAEGRQAELRLLAPSRELPMGGAAVELWASVENPNAFGITLTRIEGELFFGDGTEAAEAAEVVFPLGVSLAARDSSVVPLEARLGFDQIPGLADAARSALLTGVLPYELTGTFSVAAGVLGTPTFGPATLLRGEVQVLR